MTQSQVERALTPKQARFVDEYLVDLNATQAYLRAGYAAGSTPQATHANAARLLENDRVATLVAERKAELARRLGITQEHVLREYARIAFADMRNYATWGPDGVILKASDELTPDEAAAVAEVGETTSKDGGSLKFKLHDKLKALDKLAEYTEVVRPAGGVNIHGDKVLVNFNV